MGFLDALNTSLVDYSSDMAKQDTKYVIKSWLREHARSSVIANKLIVYDITDDLKINVKSDCHIILGKKTKNIAEFPDYINFNICKGDFKCSSLGLTTLRGCPKTVYGSFDCSNNNLLDLEGGPITLESKRTSSEIKKLKRLPAYANYRSSLEIDYHKISYNCSNNQIMIFNGKPKNTKNCIFNCANNPIIYKTMEFLAGKFDRGYELSSHVRHSTVRI